MNNGLKKPALSLGLGKHTFITHKAKLFWAFYITLLLFRLLHLVCLRQTFVPGYGLSDVVLAIFSEIELEKK